MIGDGVQAEQRAIKEPELFEPVAEVWVPYTVHGPEGIAERVEVEPGDRYASVDDVADGRVVLDVSDWPQLDGEGRLHWDTEPVEASDAHLAFQARVDAERFGRGMTGPDRAVRVGDAFLVRGLPVGATSLLEADEILDISAAARKAAKAAMYGAAASTLEERDAEKLNVGAAYEEAAPEDGYFDVRQQKPPGPEGPASPPAAGARP